MTNLPPFIETIRQNIAKLLNVSGEYISVKAKTAEGLGSIGEGEAIECFAVVLLDK